MVTGFVLGQLKQTSFLASNTYTHYPHTNMYLNFQQVLAGGLAFTGLYKSKDDVISSGTITDYCVQKCLDAEGTVRGGNSGGQEAEALC